MDLLSQYDDKTLFLLIAKDDEGAFREIFSRYAPRLHPFVCSIVKSEDVAEEVVQEVFLRVWVKRDALPEIEKPESWLYRIASNLSITHFRRQRLEKEILNSDQFKNAGTHTEADDFTLKELQTLIHQATNLLSPKRREVFKLSREQGLSRKEIAQKLDISENTVRNQLVLALEFVQEYIRRKSGFYIPVVFLLPILDFIQNGIKKF